MLLWASTSSHVAFSYVLMVFLCVCVILYEPIRDDRCFEKQHILESSEKEILLTLMDLLM